MNDKEEANLNLENESNILQNTNKYAKPRVIKKLQKRPPLKLSNEIQSQELNISTFIENINENIEYVHNSSSAMCQDNLLEHSGDDNRNSVNNNNCHASNVHHNNIKNLSPPDKELGFINKVTSIFSKLKMSNPSSTGNLNETLNTPLSIKINQNDIEKDDKSCTYIQNTEFDNNNNSNESITTKEQHLQVIPEEILLQDNKEPPKSLKQKKFMEKLQRLNLQDSDDETTETNVNDNPKTESEPSLLFEPIIKVKSAVPSKPNILNTENEMITSNSHENSKIELESSLPLPFPQNVLESTATSTLNQHKTTNKMTQPTCHKNPKVLLTPSVPLTSPTKTPKNQESFNKSSSSKNSKRNESKFFICYNCGSTKHKYMSCPEPITKFCKKCGWEDVTDAECPYCNGTLIRPGSTTPVPPGGGRTKKW